jgi:predicted SAM-dependent methyltransferase
MSLLNSLGLRVLPAHVLSQVRIELRLASLRAKTRGMSRRYADQRNLRVNIGSGDKGKPDWVNVDAFPAPGVNCVYDCRVKLPFADKSVSMIFCEHFFEHLDPKGEAPRFLRECRRVLDPAGVIRIIVPDAELYLRAYCEPGWDTMTQLRTLDAQHNDPYLKTRYETKMQLVNAVFRQSYEHRYAYDYETLALAVREAGFSDVRRQRYAESRVAELALDQLARSYESLYVEASP